MTLILLAVVTVWGLLLAVLERRFPLRPRTQPFGARFRTNLLLALTQLAAASLVVVPAAAWLRVALDAEGWGLLPALDLGPTLAAACGVLLLDASFYLWHRANHRLTFLWRFHRVHHSDPDLDVTTALRFHFGEVLLSTTLRIAQLLLMGVPAAAFLIYAGAFQAAVLFHHSNLCLPVRLDRALSWLIVTPRLHGVHHSQVRAETNSNFSVLTSLWDRIGGSLRHATDDRAVRIGLSEYPADPDNRPLRTLARPFVDQVKESQR
jgi:sterol desaturase/sphingolipid hydroxylase (fatty acid hydroxylase superfamily)